MEQDQINLFSLRPRIFLHANPFRVFKNEMVCLCITTFYVGTASCFRLAKVASVKFEEIIWRFAWKSKSYNFQVMYYKYYLYFAFYNYFPGSDTFSYPKILLVLLTSKTIYRTCPRNAFCEHATTFLQIHVIMVSKLNDKINYLIKLFSIVSPFCSRKGKTR